VLTRGASQSDCSEACCNDDCNEFNGAGTRREDLKSAKSPDLSGFNRDQRSGRIAARAVQKPSAPLGPVKSTSADTAAVDESAFDF
jgi:hypothetical protein